MLSLDSEKDMKHSVWNNGKKMPGQIRQYEDTNVTKRKDWVITSTNATVQPHLHYYNRQNSFLCFLSFAPPPYHLSNLPKSTHSLLLKYFSVSICQDRDSQLFHSRHKSQKSHMFTRPTSRCRAQGIRKGLSTSKAKHATQ